VRRRATSPCDLVRPRATSCVPVRFRALLTAIGFVRPRASPCDLVRPRAISCDLVRPRATSCVPVRPRASPCDIVRCRATSPCDLVRPRATSCVPVRSRALLLSTTLATCRAISCAAKCVWFHHHHWSSSFDITIGRQWLPLVVICYHFKIK
jgi:hypothetical protein